MLFKLGEILGAQDSLSKLVNAELPIKVSYRLLKLLRSCSEELKTLEEARLRLVKKYAEEKKEGKEMMKVSKENQEKFRQEFGQLLEEEIEVDFDPILLDELGNITFSTIDLINLGKIIKEK